MNQQLTNSNRYTANIYTNGNKNNPSSTIRTCIGDDNSPWGFSVICNWGQDDGVGQMSDNGDGTWSITITPSGADLDTNQSSLAVEWDGI